MSTNSYYLTLTTADRPGIVSQISTFLANKKLNILESSQYGDASTSKFFLRTHFQAVEGSDLQSLEQVKDAFTPIGNSLESTWELHRADEKPKVLLMVSKIGHCLNDLLFRQSTGQLPIQIPAIVSNHPDFAPLAASYNIPFHHIPVTKDTKPEAEAKVLEIIKDAGIELVVLARYMQVMSADFCDKAPPIINIHHSFLPSFAGARPYHQAFDKGVKLIGATAHFATSGLDEGPIIEQDTARVNHNQDPKSLTHLGSTIECTVLARAVKYMVERRVLLNGTKTVVFA